MADNYVIVADFCDRAGPFLKFEKNRHIAARKLRFQFGSALKQTVFGLKTVTALCKYDSLQTWPQCTETVPSLQNTWKMATERGRRQVRTDVHWLSPTSQIGLYPGEDIASYTKTTTQALEQYGIEWYRKLRSDRVRWVRSAYHRQQHFKCDQEEAVVQSL